MRDEREVDNDEGILEERVKDELASWVKDQTHIHKHYLSVPL